MKAAWITKVRDILVVGTVALVVFLILSILFQLEPQRYAKGTTWLCLSDSNVKSERIYPEPDSSSKPFEEWPIEVQRAIREAMSNVPPGPCR